VKIVSLICLLLLSANITAQYIYESNQALFDLTNQSDTTSLNSGDDQLSAAFNLDFTFQLYDNSYTSARMATNGCLHFGLGTGNINFNNYCGDYTPDPLPQYTNTLFPFWTDLIRDSNSQMLAKNFSDKSVFGWYDLREYNRSGSDNSFEVVLWTNNTFEFRYGALDIINHDVLIGQQGSSSQTYMYLFHDECSTGTTNVAGTCVNTNWNNTLANSLLENGGSLYGAGSGNNIDCSNPLNDSTCPGYWEAFDDLQCNLDPQYAPFCPGYRFENDIGYFALEEDFGYTEEYEQSQLGYDEDYEIEQFGYSEDWFEDDRQTFGQEPIEEWFEPEIIFNDEGFVVLEEYDSISEEVYIDFDIQSFDEEPMLIALPSIEYDPIQRLDIFDSRELIDLYEFETIIREEIIHEEEINEVVFEDFEDLEEWFEEEMEAISQDDEVIEIAQNSEQLVSEIGEQQEVIEEIVEADPIMREEGGRSNMDMNVAMSVVSNTITTAVNSVSGTTAGNSIHASGNTVNSGSISSAINGGTNSDFSSGSISNSFANSSMQTQQVLSSSVDTGSITTNTTETTVSSLESGSSVSISTTVASNSGGNTTTETNTTDSLSTMATSSEADTVTENVVAQNLKDQQEELKEQQESGEYGEEAGLVAVMGFNPDFVGYYDRILPDNNSWYESKSIYTSVQLNDNIQGFYAMAGQNFTVISQLINSQPRLNGGRYDELVSN
tara:strand:+ start:262 stop:2421 length:2160 start_codon:yes stop_codon:yes gene_type:complete